MLVPVPSGAAPMSDDTEQDILEDETESDRFVLVDPENYAESQKIRAIFRAERDVKKFIGKRGLYSINEQLQLSELVRIFCVEMWPVIVDSIQSDIISKDDVSIPSKNLYYDDMRSFVQNDRMNLPDALFHKGRTERTSNKIETLHSMWSKVIFYHFVKLKQKLGLGISIDVDKSPAEV